MENLLKRSSIKESKSMIYNLNSGLVPIIDVMTYESSLDPRYMEESFWESERESNHFEIKKISIGMVTWKWSHTALKTQ